MPHLLAFRADYAYKTTSLGISVPVRLQCGEASIEIEAKIDTGAGCCIFARIHGEGLGLQIESGIRQDARVVSSHLQCPPSEIRAPEAVRLPVFAAIVL